MPKRPHPSLRLPKGWTRRVRSAAVHAIALARLALTTARGQVESVRSGSGRIERLTEEILLLKEEMRVKDARMVDIPAQRRPHYLPSERLATPRAASRPRVVAGSDRRPFAGDLGDHRFVDVSP